MGTSSGLLKSTSNSGKFDLGKENGLVYKFRFSMSYACIARSMSSLASTVWKCV